MSTPTGNPRGRPTVWNPQLEIDLLGFIEKGATYDDACALAGISRATFYEHKADFPDFSDAVDRARVRQKQAHIQNVGRCAFGVPKRDAQGNAIAGQWDVPPDGKLSMLYLQARYPEEYSRHRIELANAKGETLKVSHTVEVLPQSVIESEIAAMLSIPAITTPRDDDDDDIIETPS